MRGYSLLEAVLAGTLFATGLAAILSATSSYMTTVEHDRKLGEAWRVLQGQATHLRALPPTASEWASSTSVTVDRFGRAGSDYTITRDVTTNAPHTGATTIRLTANWLERTVPRTATLVIHR